MVRKLMMTKLKPERVIYKGVYVRTAYEDQAR